MPSSPSTIAPAATLGARLTGARKNAGLTRELAAVRTGRSWSSISFYERDVAIPPLPILRRLADTYGVRLVDLLDGATFADARAACDG